MACERHREDLLGAAAGWLEPQREPGLHAHLRACPACREEFQRQQRLFAAMEQGLRERVNEELPLGFAARVRARMKEQAAPRRRWILRWVPAWGAVAAAAALAVALFIVQTIRRVSVRQESLAAPVARTVAPHDGLKPPRAAPAETPDKNPAVQPARVQTVSAPVRITLPHVLLPAGQKVALARLVEGLRSGKVQGQMLLAESAGLKPVEIAPLEINALEWKPLDGTDQQPQ